MAIKKEIVFTNGIRIEYHRIADMIFSNGAVEVKVLSYVDDTYRQIEKQNDDNNKEYERLLGLIAEEHKKVQEERNKKNLIEWSNQANALEFKEGLNLDVVAHNIKFEGVTDFSLANIYELLKQQDFFLDASDC